MRSANIATIKSSLLTSIMQQIPQGSLSDSAIEEALAYKEANIKNEYVPISGNTELERIYGITSPHLSLVAYAGYLGKWNLVDKLLEHGFTAGNIRPIALIGYMNRKIDLEQCLRYLKFAAHKFSLREKTLAVRCNSLAILEFINTASLYENNSCIFNSDNDGLLDIAVKSNNSISVLTFLIEHNCQPNRKSESFFGGTPPYSPEIIYNAIKNNNIEAVKLIVNRFKICDKKCLELSAKIAPQVRIHIYLTAFFAMTNFWNSKTAKNFNLADQAYKNILNEKDKYVFVQKFSQKQTCFTNEPSRYEAWIERFGAIPQDPDIRAAETKREENNNAANEEPETTSEENTTPPLMKKTIAELPSKTNASVSEASANNNNAYSEIENQIEGLSSPATRVGNIGIFSSAKSVTQELPKPINSDVQFLSILSNKPELWLGDTNLQQRVIEHVQKLQNLAEPATNLTLAKKS